MSAPEFRETSWRRVAAIVAGLVLLIGANYYLRHTLEEAPRRLYSFMEYFYAPQIPVVFAKPWWQLLLPIPEFTGAWAASTMILTYAVERQLTPGGAWELYNAITIVVAFVTSWVLFRSAVFSFTLAICLGFGTHFYHAYAVTGGITSYLMLIYNLLLLCTAAQMVRGAAPRAAWIAAFIVSAGLNVVGYEGWLDVLVVVWLASPLAYVALKRMRYLAEARRLIVIAGVLTVIGGLYIVVKVTMGFGQAQGSESDVVFNYDRLAPFVDDVISNAFTHTYLSVSNFLPPAFVGSSAMYWLGADYLVNAQHQYHSEVGYLVPMNQVFFWRYYAGAVFAILLGAIVYTWRRVLKQPSPWLMALGIFLLMILAAGPTHSMIKFRPMKSMPVMTYHVTVGVLGVSLLISWLLTTAWQRWPDRRRSVPLIAGVWLLIFYGALARPPYLAHMSAQVGLGEHLYPNPMRTLLESLGATYHAPAGLSAYRLMPFRADEGLAAVRAALPDFPGRLPPLDQWQPGNPEWVKPADGGVEVNGDDTQFGYQIMSPPIAVAPASPYIVRVRFDVRDGRLCAGVLSGDQQRWLVAPDGKTPEYAFDSGDLTSIRVVIANCYGYDRGNPRSRFVLRGGSFAQLVSGKATP